MGEAIKADNEATAAKTVEEAAAKATVVEEAADKAKAVKAPSVNTVTAGSDITSSLPKTALGSIGTGKVVAAVAVAASAAAAIGYFSTRKTQNLRRRRI